jgi:hypothetical protein
MGRWFDVRSLLALKVMRIVLHGVRTSCVSHPATVNIANQRGVTLSRIPWRLQDSQATHRLKALKEYTTGIFSYRDVNVSALVSTSRRKCHEIR